jgi:hypothetical protein
MGKSLSGRNLSQYRVMHDLSHYLYEVADAVIEAQIPATLYLMRRMERHTANIEHP